jgi:hypothetical protein
MIVGSLADGNAQPSTRTPDRRIAMTRRTRTTVRALGAVATTFTLAALLTVPTTAPASADRPNSVIAWDQRAERAIWDVAGQQPYVTRRSFAMVHGAVYDAVNAIDGNRFQPLISSPPATGRESVDAAVASAAYRVLDSLFPDQRDRLRAEYTEYLATLPDQRSRQSGIEVGRQAAAAMISARAGDGAFGPQTWTVGTRPGEWRPTPPLFLSDAAWVGHVRPFVIPDRSMFSTAGPPALNSRAYARDLNEVKALGSVDSTVRTKDQTESAIWWHDRRLTEWEIKRNVATTQRLGVRDAARLFALVDITTADTGIACFTEKEKWNFWRPVTAVRLADTDGNPWTSPDPEWTSLLVTPPFPDYTSGHACGTSAMMAALRHFFGRDDISFSAYSADSGTRRSFTSFSQARDEVNLARIWGGVHFRSADLQGSRIGEQVAEYVIEHAFRPRRP